MTKGTQSFMLFAIAGAIFIALTFWRLVLVPLHLGSAPLTSPVEAPAIPASEPAPAAAPAIRHPLAPSALPLRAGDIGAALDSLLGRESVASFLQIDEFPRRVVATVDNLGRSHAPSMLWPVHPTADRFTVAELDSGPVIGAENAGRYVPFVSLVEAVDAGRAADLYLRMYPLMQRAYEQLGYPNQYFNDRLIAVIDLLLATPEPEYPVKLHLTQVRGPVVPLRPWVRYEFADPALESLSAGQKMLLRVGPVNERRLKDKLAEFRRELVRRAPLR